MSFILKITKAKTNSQLSLKSEKMENVPTKLPSCKSLQKQKKFSRFLKKKNNIVKKTIKYAKLYESLHNDIQNFNFELDAYNQENLKIFDELIENIRSLIKKKFPGIN